MNVIHWVIKSFIGWDYKQYLDKFVPFLPAVKAILETIWIDNNKYGCLTDIFWIPRKKTKDFEGTVVSIFGIEVDIKLFTTRLLLDK